MLRSVHCAWLPSSSMWTRLFHELLLMTDGLQKFFLLVVKWCSNSLNEDESSKYVVTYEGNVKRFRRLLSCSIAVKCIFSHYLKDYDVIGERFRCFRWPMV